MNERLLNIRHVNVILLLAQIATKGVSMASVQKAYRVDEELYKETDSTLQQMGMSIPQAITMFFKRIVMEQRLPFTPAVIKSPHQLEAENQIGELLASVPSKTLDLGKPSDIEEFYRE
jgi:addiction module RelB/DinJ family antitoxin